jgi:transposase InsO family protein
LSLLQVLFKRNGKTLLTGEKPNETLFQLHMKPNIHLTQSDNRQPLTLVALGADLRASIITWHRRLGHISYHTLLKMVKEDLTVGLNINGDRDIPATLCSNCEFGKLSRIPLKTGRNRATRIGELTHSDVWGPIANTSIRGARYFVTFKDDYSGYTTVYLMKRKNEVPALFRLYHALLLNETGFYMLTLRSDNGKGEYVNKKNAEWLAQHGIRHETSAPHTPEQNGSAERLNRTLLEPVRYMIIESGLPACLWAEAISYTTYIKNWVLSRTTQLTPYEYWNERKPDMTHIRIFGCKAFVRNPTVLSKLESCSQEGFFVGRCLTQNASRIYIPAKKIIVNKRRKNR